MIECNISRWAKIILIIQLFLVIAEAQKSVTPIGSSSKNASLKLKYAYDTKRIVELATAFRFNVLVIGGIFNMTLSLINLIFGLVNFYFIVGRYDSRLRQIAEKLRIAVEEMASRDLHPKIKMSLSRKIPPDNVSLLEITKLFKEPSKLFDNANGLFADQREARLRKMNVKKEKEENTVTVKSPAPKSSQQNSAVTNPKSKASEVKKVK